MNSQLIDRYLEGATVPSLLIVGLGQEDLDAFPVPGTWSIRQIVLHLMDSDLVASDRMKRVIAEKNPTLLAYNETAFAKELGYDRLDVALACRIFEMNRRMMASILVRLPAEAFTRTGNHTEEGPLTLERLVHIYVGHLDHHVKFIRNKRQLLGKPLA